jgi:hypothetical protein
MFFRSGQGERDVRKTRIRSERSVRPGNAGFRCRGRRAGELTQLKFTLRASKICKTKRFSLTFEDVTRLQEPLTR